MCYLVDLRSANGHALLVLNKSKIKVAQKYKTFKDIPITHASMAQRAKCQIQMAEVLGSVLTGVTFCCTIFLFSPSKASDANITNIVIFVCL